MKINIKTVDGWNRAPVERKVLYIPAGDRRISEPSTASPLPGTETQNLWACSLRQMRCLSATTSCFETSHRRWDVSTLVAGKVVNLDMNGICYINIWCTLYIRYYMCVHPAYIYWHAIPMQSLYMYTNYLSKHLLQHEKNWDSESSDALLRIMWLFSA